MFSTLTSSSRKIVLLVFALLAGLAVLTGCSVPNITHVPLNEVQQAQLDTSEQVTEAPARVSTVPPVPDAPEFETPASRGTDFVGQAPQVTVENELSTEIRVEERTESQAVVESPVIVPEPVVIPEPVVVPEPVVEEPIIDGEWGVENPGEKDSTEDICAQQGLEWDGIQCYQPQLPEEVIGRVIEGPNGEICTVIDVDYTLECVLPEETVSEKD